MKKILLWLFISFLIISNIIVWILYYFVLVNYSKYSSTTETQIQRLEDKIVELQNKRDFSNLTWTLPKFINWQLLLVKPKSNIGYNLLLEEQKIKKIDWNIYFYDILNKEDEIVYIWWRKDLYFDRFKYWNAISFNEDVQRYNQYKEKEELFSNSVNIIEYYDKQIREDRQKRLDKQRKESLKAYIEEFKKNWYEYLKLDGIVKNQIKDITTIKLDFTQPTETWKYLKDSVFWEVWNFWTPNIPILQEYLISKNNDFISKHNLFLNEWLTLFIDEKEKKVVWCVRVYNSLKKEENIMNEKDMKMLVLWDKELWDKIKNDWREECKKLLKL